MYTTEVGLTSEPKGVWLCLICVLLPDGQVRIIYIYALMCFHRKDIQYVYVHLFR